MAFFQAGRLVRLIFLFLLILSLCSCNSDTSSGGSGSSSVRDSRSVTEKAVSTSVPEIRRTLGRSSQIIDLAGTAGSKMIYTDFGGEDIYTVLPAMAGNVEIRDNQASTINLPAGLSFSAARFLSNGVQFTINGFTLTLLGKPGLFTFVFAGNSATPGSGVSRTFAETAGIFGTSIPSSGQPNDSTIAGTILSDGGLNSSAADLAPPSVPTGLTASSASSSSVSLSWTASTDNVGVTGYRIYRDGTLKATVNTLAWQETGLTASTSYCYTVSAVDAAGNESAETAQACAVTQDASEVKKLNDTGINWWSNESSNGLTSPQADFPGQDADYGRDRTNNDDSDGHAGFSYTKIGADGEVLPVVAAQWSAVLDNVTGLMWENKTDDGGLHDKDNTYTWYEPDNTKNGGYAGTWNGGYCPEGNCDTWHFVQAVNAEKYCGKTDWRMPTRMELYSIVNYNEITCLSIDSLFFSNITPDSFWSSSPSAYQGDSAWGVIFTTGNDGRGCKSNRGDVRLVRSGQ